MGKRENGTGPDTFLAGISFRPGGEGSRFPPETRLSALLGLARALRPHPVLQIPPIENQSELGAAFAPLSKFFSVWSPV